MSDLETVLGLAGQAYLRAQEGDLEAALALQEEAVARSREAGDVPGFQVIRRVLLYNLAMLCGQAGRHSQAVAALEEVVALDERFGHPNLGADRQALEAARWMAARSPEEQAELAGRAREFAAWVATLPPEKQERLWQIVRELNEQQSLLSPEEQAAVVRAARPVELSSLAAGVRDAAIEALRGEREEGPLLEHLRALADWAGQDVPAGSERDLLAAYLRAVIALLEGAPPPPVPPAYTGQIAAIREACPTPEPDSSKGEPRP